MIINPFSAVLIVTALVAIGAATLVRRNRRQAPGAQTLIWLLAAIAWWALSAALGRATPTLEGKMLAAQLEYIGVESVPLLWLIFTSRFTGRDRWMTPARLALLAIIPVTVLALAWTNPWHGLLWRSATIGEIAGYPLLRVSYGPAGWLNVAYAYALMLTGVVNVVVAFWNTPGFYTPQVAILLISATAPWIANAVYMTNVGPVDLTPVAFTITALGAVWALARFHLLDLIPVARALVIDHLREAVFVIDAGGRIVDANPAACALLDAEAACVGRPLAAVLPDLESSAAVYELRRGDGGDARIYEVTQTPLSFGHHRHAGRLLVLRDVTQRRRGEEQLRAAHAELEARVRERTVELAQANAALRTENDSRQRLELELRERLDELRLADAQKNAFLATLAHELRNPLAPISNAVQFLTAGGSPPAQHGAALAIIDRQVRQMSRLVDDMLDLSRITRDRLQLRKEWIDLRDVLHLAEETTRPVIEQNRHRYAAELPDQPLLVFADPTRLAQIFSNLIHNAAKFTPPGGRIDVRVRSEEDTFAVSVRDNGIGIASGELRGVFDMFTQLEPGAGQIHGGLGIGLTLAKRLVEMHGGSIEVSSEGRGHGSEFTVRLPRAARAAAGLPAGAEKESGALHCRIEVVDDNHDSADSLSMALAAMGADVRTAYDGFEAIAVAEQFHPDMIIMDIGMPRMDGCEAARRIRGLEGGGEVLLVALTGWNQAEDRRRTAEAGFDYHFAKPIDPSLLGTLLSEPGRDLRN